ncbi:fimbria/pilus outer membrane usher protein [Escherichia coli]|uniref:fimbria/pilus outer membrane usher protein n=1 Tax=Escherichia coli TaxID=562 RepID=UPI000A183165|nr:fimbria/pilus outer membrane usher protein [Escherichia coli]OSL84470.1 fimbrial biogenesis outer membrane usher protein [Escherichia coli T426]
MKLRKIKVGLMLLLSWQEVGEAEMFSFNRAHLHGTAQVDLQKYQYSHSLYPGHYRSTLSVNGRDLAEETFVVREYDGLPEPCISSSLFDALQLKDAQWPAAVTCLRFSQINKSISWEYDSGENVLRVNIPQALLQPHYRGAVNLKKVDRGIPAAVLRYQANSYQSTVSGDTRSHHYLGLDASLHAFGWRLHHQSSYQVREGNTHWDSIATWAEKSLVNWASTLQLGQGGTDGTFFDSVSFIGGRLSTDVRMLPGSRRGFAPSVSGVARTNARVTVTQNGALLYEATVQPGKFTFDDLYPTNAGGDLQVTIHEADGSKETFTVPYAVLPGLVRAGAVYYNLSLGYLDDGDWSAGQSEFGEATLQYGFNDYVSGYTGANATSDYYSTLVGSALNTYWGALAVDLSRSAAKERGHGWQEGHRWRVSVSKSFSPDTRMLVSMSHSNDGNYRSIRDVAREYDRHSNDWREMTRYSMTLSQQAGSGSLSFNGIWSEDVRHHRWRTYQFGYANRYGQLNYYLYAQQSQDIYHCNNQVVGISFSLPFRQAGNLTTRFNHDKNYGNQLQSSYTGSYGEKNAFSYGLTASYDMPHDNSHEASIGGNGSLRTDYAYLNASASAGRHQLQYSLGASGAMVAHQGGMTATPELGETFAIVEAPGATGARVANRPGQPINRQGFTIIPYLEPFTDNWLDLDPQGLDDHVEIVSSSTTVVPDLGAAVKVKFVTRTGYPWFVHVTLPDGAVPPLGSEVFDDSGQVVGAVGQGGLLYARVPHLHGSISVVWGERRGQRCGLAYDIHGDTAQQVSIGTLHQVCRPGLKENEMNASPTIKYGAQ